MKSPILTATRFLAVTILYFGSFVVVSGALLSTASNESTPADAGATLIALLVVSLLNAAVWTYVIRRSGWTGWKLVLTVFLVFYGANTLMPQIETAYFVTRLPPGMLPRLFLAGLIIAAVFAPLAVLILGKTRPESQITRLKILAGGWPGRRHDTSAAMTGFQSCRCSGGKSPRCPEGAPQQRNDQSWQ